MLSIPPIMLQFCSIYSCLPPVHGARLTATFYLHAKSDTKPIQNCRRRNRLLFSFTYSTFNSWLEPVNTLLEDATLLMLELGCSTWLLGLYLWIDYTYRLGTVVHSKLNKCLSHLGCWKTRNAQERNQK